ncbi:ATP-binding cassette domain-containing protein [Tsukamurella sp. 8F]|uniref:ATP-binding cassette domain-containing protein n=1 Tax=unclassified Tsukamurella TaxID=2633480 RepID=UPI0023B8F8A0|nr:MULTISPECIES: ATP-binding cassette domain-containing protein [unclassified Tsukamurella]MDF0529316.1 ATP-binding cassette domain-containing protein [Tsukamurella sp. 8J]MDF0587177.1 ATP-binding cassette domain-containing protein [Tsukamurella sp. 8F]
MIEVDGLVKTFGGVRALDGVSLSVPGGTVLGLLGPNGSGKTTTVSVLSTLVRPDAGHATIGGHDVVDEAERVRELVSLTGQYASLDQALTVRENLTMFGRLTGLRRRDTAAQVDHLADTYDLGEFLDRRVGALSGGMRRRVDIACALVTRPQVLFLDEPTTGLDPRSRQAVWAAVRGLRAEGITVLLTTQYLEEADQLADRIVMLGSGRVLAEGTPGELKARTGAAVCEVTLAAPSDSERVVAALAACDLQASVDGAAGAHPVVRVPAADGADTLRRVLDVLAGVEFIDAGLRQPSLDEVFLSLTDTTRADA